MQKYVFPITQGRHFNVGSVVGSAVTAEGTQERGDVAILEVRGPHGMVKDVVSCRFYVVTEGQGTFNIESKMHTVQKNDVIIIPPKTSYDFDGHMNMVMFCSPAFDPKNEIKKDQ